MGRFLTINTFVMCKRWLFGLLLAAMFSVMGAALNRFNVIRLLAFAIILSVMVIAVPIAQAAGPNLVEVDAQHRKLVNQT